MAGNDGIADAPGVTVHATAIAIGETGVLIRGRSGSGKSTLARQLLERAARAGRFASLVSDDRVILARCHGRLVARAVPAIAGLLEVRGAGIVGMPFLPAAVVELVVDADVKPDRLPETCDKMTTILDTRLPRLAAAGMTDAPDVVFWLIAQGQSTSL
ncbi:HPr kinase/phosphorylase [Pseudochelatococcus sp. B33]